MKYLLVLLTLLCFEQVSIAQQQFEGRVHQKITAPAAPSLEMSIVMSIKGDKLLMDIAMGPAGELKIYTQNGSPTMTSVIVSSGRGYEVDKNTSIPEANTPITGFAATGRKDKINGYAAEEWSADLDNGTSMRIWLTSEIDPSLIKALHTSMQAQDAQDPNPTRSAITRAITQKNMAAVRTIILAGGAEQAIVDLVKIEKITIPDQTFEIPADIKVVKM